MALPIWQQPSARAFILLTTILVLWYFHAQRSYYRDPGSRFFDEDRAYERHYSAVRERQAKEWIARLNANEIYKDMNEDPIHASPKNATICATILTTLRPPLDNYVDLTLASALDRLTPAERRSIYFSIFFATSQSYRHESWHRPWIRNVTDSLYTYEDYLTPADVSQAGELELANDGVRKAPFDYTIPIRNCLENTRAKYILVLEDDVLLADGWLARTLLNLRDMEARMKAQGRRGEWLFLRLFTTEKSKMRPHRQVGANGEYRTAFFSSIVIGAAIVALRRRWFRLRRNCDNATIAVVCLWFIPLAIILYNQCGEASIQPPAPGIKEEVPGCCAQALVWNRNFAEHLSEYMLQRRTEGHHDLVANDFARMHGLARWTQYPVVAQHVGLHTSIVPGPGASFQRGRRIWSMAFEGLNPKKLAREHGQMVRKLFG